MGAVAAACRLPSENVPRRDLERPEILIPRPLRQEEGDNMTPSGPRDATSDPQLLTIAPNGQLPLDPS